MVAIVLPLYKKFALLGEAEKISLYQLFKVMSSYDIFFVTHEELDIDEYYQKANESIQIKRINFKKEFFANIAGYNQLLLSEAFYRSFEEYEYILITQLDVFIFSDQLKHFTSLGNDYIGAPFFEGYSKATESSQIKGVGNGGFSLRKVKSFLAVLNLFSIFNGYGLSISFIKELIKNPISFLRIVKNEVFKTKYPLLSVLPKNFKGNEDVFWSEFVKMFFPTFKVANIPEAISFAFEANPSILYELNNNRLPMATHAWEKYDFNFWKPIIMEFGYSINNLEKQL